MTTPRDAIGLSDRLLAEIGQPVIYRNDAVLREAATALDALSAENEHMADTIIKLNEYLTDANARTEQAEARMKELEVNRDHFERLYRRTDTECAAAESRATSAEQQRDEAYERLKPFADAAESLNESHLDRMDLWESPIGLEITAGHLRAARDLVRRLAAGTEKEGK